MNKKIYFPLLFGMLIFAQAKSQCNLTADFDRNPDLACVGSPVVIYDLSDNGGDPGPYTWNWNFGAGAIPATFTGQNPPIVTYATPGTKNITLTYTSTGGSCTDVRTRQIDIIPQPSVSFTSNAPQCVGAQVNFTYTGSAMLTYQWDFGVGATPQASTVQNPQGIVYSSAGTKTITLTADNGTCTSTITQTIVINTTPAANFSSTTPACTGDSVDFLNTGTTGATYAWDFGSGASPATSTAENPSDVVYSTAGIKTVTLITTLGTCADTGIQTIDIKQTPAPAFTSNAPQCEGAIVTFTYTGTTGLGWTYNWDFGTGATPALSSSQNPGSVFYSTAGTKTITLTVTNDICSQTITGTIIINPLPLADAGKDTVICNNVSVQIGSSPVTGNTYSWFPSSTLDSATIANPVSSPIAPVTIYIVTVTGTNGCTSIDSIVVIMLSPLIANAGTDGEICLYDSVQIGAGLIQGQTYLWVPNTWLTNNTLPNPVASPSITTTYTLYVSGSGCGPETDEVTIIVHPLPLAEAGPDDTITIGSATQLTATGGIQYSWYPSYGLSNTGIYNPVANPTDTITYYVIVTDVFGCSNIDSVTVFVIDASFWVPSAFTPNDDGANDVLYVRGSGIEDLKFAIFNRWGEQVFYTELIEIGWEGTRQGSREEVPEGAYAYFVRGTLTNGKAIDEKGLVNLIR